MGRSIFSQFLANTALEDVDLCVDSVAWGMIRIASHLFQETIRICAQGLFIKMHCSLRDCAGMTFKIFCQFCIKRKKHLGYVKYNPIHQKEIYTLYEGNEDLI